MDKAKLVEKALVIDMSDDEDDYESIAAIEGHYGLVPEPNERIRNAYIASGLTRTEFGSKMGLPTTMNSRGQWTCPTLDAWLRPPDNKAYRPASVPMARLAEFACLWVLAQKQ